VVHARFTKWCGCRRRLLESLPCRWIGSMLIDEMGLEGVFVVERAWAEGTVKVSAMNAGELMVVGPADFGGNKQAVVTAEED
jgi:hypothetical protein